MKKALTIILLFAITCSGVSQVTICERDALMYSRCYRLKENGTFSYRFSHCTGSVIGLGYYYKSKGSIEFKFDSLKSPIIRSYYNEHQNTKINILLLDIISEYPLEFILIKYKNKKYWTDSTGVLSIDYLDGNITIHHSLSKDSLIINPNLDKKNKYLIYSHSHGDAFVRKGKVIKLKKVGKKYRLKKRIRCYTEKKQYYSCIKTFHYTTNKK